MPTSMTGSNARLQESSSTPVGLMADGVGISLSGGLARRSRGNLFKRANSSPENAVMEPPVKLVLGVCAMDKKAKSKPMREILQRMTLFNEFHVVVFGDKTILEEPVEKWPVCDCLLSWHSDGFPLNKAKAYVALRHPFCINDVTQQEIMLDRRRVYTTLKANFIPVPSHIIVNRERVLVPKRAEPAAGHDDMLTDHDPQSQHASGGGSEQQQAAHGERELRGSRPGDRVELSGTLPTVPEGGSTSSAATTNEAATVTREDEGGDGVGHDNEQPQADEQEMEWVWQEPPGFIEDHDYVELNGVRINKPFVEKPIDGENHNIYIYYPHNHGGGVKRLFRKVDDKSADYDPHHPGNVRRDGSYIYEEFLTTGGTDVKVYTVGPRYAHAEARKSPVVDGKVLRTPDGKEMRYPVLLSPQEKEIARMVVLAFGQKVCGFDLLRSEKGKSYVCDVNGWSFVKNSTKYYDDAAGILRSMILTALAPQRVMTLPMLLPAPIPVLTEEQHEGHDGSLGGAFRIESVDMAGMKNVPSLDDMGMLAGEDDEDDEDYNPSEELRCVLAVIRHGDRTPKQKIKIKITQGPLLALFDKYRNSKGDQAKLKTPQQLQELLRVVRDLLTSLDRALETSCTTPCTISDTTTATETHPLPGIAPRAGSEGTASGPAASASAGGVDGIGAPCLTAEDGAPLQLPPELGELKDHDSLEEFKRKLTIVRTVLEQDGGHFSGVNRKVQLKPLRWKQSQSQEWKPPSPEALHRTLNSSNKVNTTNTTMDHSSLLIASNSSQSVNASSSSFGFGQSRMASSSGAAGKGGLMNMSESSMLDEALLVVKWGGVLTHAGRKQAEHLGMAFRACMYPRYGPAGGGLLRLHSTYRHDLKIYSSDEGRVQVSAAAFAKGLLDLEGNSLTPILVSLVNKDASMLEAFGKGASDEMQACKTVLQAQLTHDLGKGPPPPLPPAASVLRPSSTPPFSPARSCQPDALPFLHVPMNNAINSASHPAPHPLSTATTTDFARMSRSPEPELSDNQLLKNNNNNATAGSSAPPSVTEHTVAALNASLQSVVVSSQGATGPAASHRSTASSAAPSPAMSQGGPFYTHQQQQQIAGRKSVEYGCPRPGVAGLQATASNGEAAVAAAAAGGSRAVSMEPSEPRTLLHMPDNPLGRLQRLRILMADLVGRLHAMVSEQEKQQGTLQQSDAIQTTLSGATQSGSLSTGSSSGRVSASGNNILARAHSSAPPLPPTAAAAAAAPSRVYNSQSQDPEEWQLLPGQPCSGEKLVLLHDRWRKLHDALYSVKKQTFDISKIPDIYDSVKHDSLHNSHLGLPLEELYAVARSLADVVIPHEYGLEPVGKLSIGSKIAKELVGKLLCDMQSMKMESESTATDGDGTIVGADEDTVYGAGDTMATEFGRHCLDDDRMRNRNGSLTTAASHSAPHSAPNSGMLINPQQYMSACHDHDAHHQPPPHQQHSPHQQHPPHGPGPDKEEGVAGGSDAGDEDGQAGGGGSPQLDDMDDRGRHRLCPTYASDINSPLRHVRTRIYFTSESHIHSLMNVLRFSHLRSGYQGPHLADDDTQHLLDTTPEMDYLTHIVFRMYENMAVPVGSPDRFKVQVLFSPGAALNPLTTTPPGNDHTLPVVPLIEVNSLPGTARNFSDFQALLAPLSVQRKVNPAAYALSVAIKAPSETVSRKTSSTSAFNLNHPVSALPVHSSSTPTLATITSPVHSHTQHSHHGMTTPTDSAMRTLLPFNTFTSRDDGRSSGPLNSSSQQMQSRSVGMGNMGSKVYSTGAGISDYGGDKHRDSRSGLYTEAPVSPSAVMGSAEGEDEMINAAISSMLRKEGLDGGVGGVAGSGIPAALIARLHSAPDPVVQDVLTRASLHSE